MNPHQNHPNLGRTASTLAANHAAACAYIDSLVERIDRLVSAAARREWGQVRQQSQELAESGRAAGDHSVSTMAERVCEEAAKPDNEEGIKRSLTRLIGTSGRVGRPEAGPGSSEAC